MWRCHLRAYAGRAAPVRVCLVCGDDPSIDAGCPHYEVATVTALSSVMLHTLAELRAHHDSLRDQLRALRRLGLRVRILTNSLASHDVPAVNSHYEKWREPILASPAGATAMSTSTATATCANSSRRRPTSAPETSSSTVVTG